MIACLRLPGGFVDQFAGSDVMQGQPDKTRLDATGYPGAFAVRQAIDTADVTKVFGKGGTYLVTFDLPTAELQAALDRLDDYAETYAVGALDVRSQPRLAMDDRVSYNAADRELKACRTVRERIARLQKELADA